MADDKFNNCEYEWLILSDDDRNSPGVSKCNKYGLWLYHSNRLQLEMNKHVASSQKKISITTIAISIIALVVSIVVAVVK